MPGWFRSLGQLFAIDPRSLAAFRMSAGVLLLVDLAIRARDLSAHYTDAGILPRTMLARVKFPSLHLAGGSTEWEAGLFVLAALAALMLLVGWQTRIATIVSWYMLTSLHARNSPLLNAGDVLLRLLLLWGIFLPLARVWSLDARRRKTPHDGAPVCSLACACLILQVCCVYWFSAYFKYNEVWREGWALYYAFSYDAYARPLAIYLLQFPGLLRVLTVSTLILEAFGPVAALIPRQTKRLRLLVILSFVVLHLSIELTLTIGMFSYICILAWIPFLPDIFWDKLRLRIPPAVASAPASGPPAPTFWHTWLRRGATLLCGALFLLVLQYNYATTSFLGAKSDFMRRGQDVGRRAMLAQNWGVFRIPSKFDGWFVAAAHLSDGRVVDLLRSGDVVHWEKPALVSGMYPNHRWRKFAQTLTQPTQKHLIPPFCRYLAAQWDQSHAANERVVWIDLYWMHEQTPRPGEPQLNRQFLLHHERIAAKSAFEEARQDAGRGNRQQNGDDLPPGI